MDGWMDGLSGCYFSKCGRYKTKGQAVRGVERCFSRPIPRTPRTAVRPGSWCVTSTKAAVTAASSTMWSTASWSPTARSERSSSSHTTGATLPAAGRPSFCPSVTPAPTALAPPLDTGQVSSHICATFCDYMVGNHKNSSLFFFFFSFWMILSLKKKKRNWVGQVFFCFFFFLLCAAAAKRKCETSWLSRTMQFLLKHFGSKCSGSRLVLRAVTANQTPRTVYQ